MYKRLLVSCNLSQIVAFETILFLEALRSMVTSRIFSVMYTGGVWNLQRDVHKVLRIPQYLPASTAGRIALTGRPPWFRDRFRDSESELNFNSKFKLLVTARRRRRRRV